MMQQNSLKENEKYSREWPEAFLIMPENLRDNISPAVQETIVKAFESAGSVDAVAAVLSVGEKNLSEEAWKWAQNEKEVVRLQVEKRRFERLSRLSSNLNSKYLNKKTDKEDAGKEAVRLLKGKKTAKTTEINGFSDKLEKAIKVALGKIDSTKLLRKDLETHLKHAQESGFGALDLTPDSITKLNPLLKPAYEAAVVRKKTLENQIRDAIKHDNRQKETTEENMKKKGVEDLAQLKSDLKNIGEEEKSARENAEEPLQAGVTDAQVAAWYVLARRTDEIVKAKKDALKHLNEQKKTIFDAADAIFVDAEKGKRSDDGKTREGGINREVQRRKERAQRGLLLRVADLESRQAKLQCAINYLTSYRWAKDDEAALQHIQVMFADDSGSLKKLLSLLEFQDETPAMRTLGLLKSSDVLNKYAASQIPGMDRESLKKVSKNAFSVPVEVRTLIREKADKKMTGIEKELADLQNKFGRVSAQIEAYKTREVNKAKDRKDAHIQEHFKDSGLEAQIAEKSKHYETRLKNAKAKQAELFGDPEVVKSLEKISGKRSDWSLNRKYRHLEAHFRSEAVIETEKNTQAKVSKLTRLSPSNWASKTRSTVIGVLTLAGIGVTGWALSTYKKNEDLQYMAEQSAGAFDEISEDNFAQIQASPEALKRYVDGRIDKLSHMTLVKPIRGITPEYESDLKAKVEEVVDGNETLKPFKPEVVAFFVAYLMGDEAGKAQALKDLGLVKVRKLHQSMGIMAPNDEFGFQDFLNQNLNGEIAPAVSPEAISAREAILGAYAEIEGTYEVFGTDDQLSIRKPDGTTIALPTALTQGAELDAELLREMLNTRNENVQKKND